MASATTRSNCECTNAGAGSGNCGLIFFEKLENSRKRKTGKEKFPPEGSLPYMANSSINVWNQVYSAICMLSDVRIDYEQTSSRLKSTSAFPPKASLTEVGRESPGLTRLGNLQAYNI